MCSDPPLTIKRDEVVRRIEKFVLELLQSISSGRLPELCHRSANSRDSVMFDTDIEANNISIEVLAPGRLLLEDLCVTDPIEVSLFDARAGKNQAYISSALQS
jgi:hypothetical protein